MSDSIIMILIDEEKKKLFPKVLSQFVAHISNVSHLKLPRQKSKYLVWKY